MLSQENDAMVSALIMLIMYQNEHWLRKDTIQGVSSWPTKNKHKTFCSKRLGVSRLFGSRGKSLSVWPKLVILEGKGKDKNYVLTAAADLTERFGGDPSVILCLPHHQITSKRAELGEQ